MIKKIRGIVVSTTPFKETSQILNVLTEEGKIISLMARGSKNIKSTLKGKTNKFTYGYFYTYYKEDKISTLTTVDVIDNFENIYNSLELISYLNYLVELTFEVEKQCQSPLAFELLISALNKINFGLDPLIIKNIIEIKYLDFLGISLNLDCCNKCGNKENIIAISVSDGGFICENCNKSNITTNIKTIKMIRNYYYVNINSITKLDISENVKLEIDNILNEMYDDYTGLYIKSKKFLKNIVNLK